MRIALITGSFDPITVGHMQLVDTASDSFEMDYEKLEAAITSKTKVIVPVDIGGVMCDYKRIFEIVERKKGLFWGIAELYRLFKKIPSKKWVNPFSLVSVEFMDFTKTGQYAQNYSINLDANQSMFYVDSVQEMFGHHDTNVFKEYNPAKQVVPYVWGTDKNKDDKIMEQNFSLQDLKRNVNTNGIDISQI